MVLVKEAKSLVNSISSYNYTMEDLGILFVDATAAPEKLRDAEIAIYTSRFTPLKATLSGRDEQSLMKLVVDKRSDRVLGVHMVGADAAEIIQGLAVAVKMGATKAQFDETIGIHPTAAEEFVTLREASPDPS